MNLMKIRQMHEPGVDKLLLILGRFFVVLQTERIVPASARCFSRGFWLSQAGSFGATFSDDSGLPDAPVSVFVMFGAPRPFGVTQKLMVFYGSRAWRGTIKGGEQYTGQ